MRLLPGFTKKTLLKYQVKFLFCCPQAYRIMSETRFGPKPIQVGIVQLIGDGAYKAAFPLHEVGVRVIVGQPVRAVVSRAGILFPVNLLENC